MAYFDKEVLLSTMVHIYGNASVLTITDRPNLFVKELKYVFGLPENEITEEITLGQIKKMEFVETICWKELNIMKIYFQTPFCKH
jgi:hypothetical protein